MTAISSPSVPSNPFAYPSNTRGVIVTLVSCAGVTMFGWNFGAILYFIIRSPVETSVPIGSLSCMLIGLVAAIAGSKAILRYIDEDEAAVKKENDARWNAGVHPREAVKAAPVSAEKSVSSDRVPMSEAEKAAARQRFADRHRIRKEAEQGGEVDKRVRAIMGLWFLSQESVGRRHVVESHVIRRRAIEDLIEKMRRGEIREDSVIQCLNGAVGVIVDVMRREDCMELRRVCPRLLALCDAYTGDNNN